MNSFLLREFQNKSNRKLVEGEAEEFLALLDEGIVVLDHDLKITYVNKKALDLLYSKRPIDEKILIFCEKMAHLSFKKGQVYKKHIVEEKMNLFFEVSSIPRKEHKGVFLIFKDSTSDYKMVKMGKDFVSNASHELRTPLTIIKGYSETLNEISKLDDRTLKEIIGKIISTSSRLENIIFDLLTLAEIENLHPLTFASCDLKEVISNATSTILQGYPHVKLTIDLPNEEINLLGHGELIEMAVKNLLENAARYSTAKPEIFVSLKREKEFTTLIIKDNGIGIPEKDLPFIFDRFFRVDKARSRKLGGTGLGLSLVKNIFEKHRGTISVDSKVDEGSLFKITLPIFQ
jgi:two-component system, OmpR family, phosphate regulon sensor histidine kinase PhoR